MRRAALVLLALTLTGCQTTAEKSAKLEREAKLAQAKTGNGLAIRGLSVAQPSKKVRAVSAVVLNSSEGDAAVITLSNISSSTLENVPIEIDVKNARGATLYANDAPGLSKTLVSVALVPARSRIVWIDDQVQAAGAPLSVTAKIGEGTPVAAKAPALSVQGVHLTEAASSSPGAEGEVSNRSATTQQELVVNAVARRRGQIVAAGRAVVPSAHASSSTRFQLFFIGSPHGASLEVSAPATSVG